MFIRLPRPASLKFHKTAARWLRADVLHVFILASFALTQPAYDRLGARPAFLMRLGIHPPAIFLVMAVLSVGLPAAIVGFHCLTRLCTRRVHEALHAITIYVLLALLALPLLKRASFLPGEMVFGGALAVAALGAWSYFNLSAARKLVTHCTPGIVIFPVLFLFSSSATSILFPPQSPRPGRWNPVPVVVLVFDELCGHSLMNVDREIDADRFPNLAEFSRQSAWFRNATAVDVHTQRALPAILSGKYSTTGWSPTPADLPQNLFSVLGSAGAYDLAVFEPVTNLAPKQRTSADLDRPGIWQQAAALIEPVPRVLMFHVTPQDFYLHLPPLPDLWYDIGNPIAVDQTQRRGVFRYEWTDNRDRQFDHFLTCLSEESQPMLNFMHLMLPHVPWCYLPSGRRYTNEFDKMDLMNFHAHSGLLEYWGQDEWFVVQCQQRYLLQLEYVDRLIGRMVERLKEIGLYERCLLIVTADHGVAFRANHPRRLTTADNLGDIASIPLIIKRPFQTQGEVSDRFVESVDILPTIADVVGIELSDSTDGWSVFDESRPDRQRTMLFQDQSPIQVDRTAIAESDVPRILRKRFGDPRDPTALFRIGPAPDLIGRRIENLVQSPELPAEIELIRYGDVASDNVNELLPCFFEGRIQSPALADRPIVLAVAINGTIQAVTRTYLLDGLRNRWAALVPESSFRPGKNDVQFFVVTGTGPDWRLGTCTRQPRVK